MKKWNNLRIDSEISTRSLVRVSNCDIIQQPSTTKVDWMCSVCSNVWDATFDSVRRGSGCPFCAGNKKQTIDDCNNRLASRNKLFDCIELFNGTSNSERHGSFRCRTCNNEWTTTLSNIFSNNQGCPRCGKIGRYNNGYFLTHPTEQGHFYIVEMSLNDETFIKIGITKRTFKSRFQKTPKPYSVELLDDIQLNLHTAWLLEQQVIQCFADVRYVPLCHFGGNTECFKKSSYNSILTFVKDHIHASKT